MTEQPNNKDDISQNDDVEAHRAGLLEDEDVEGHRFKDVYVTGEADDADDVEGHRFAKGGGIQPSRDTDLGGTER